ncbi:DUF3370 family protein [Streptomyces sp. NPDC021224]|uniref:DUF3370 family protein n=1 Tax=unclassified Streptomyces TaxID=2593676 RepID=UPI0037B47FBE
MEPLSNISPSRRALLGRAAGVLMAGTALPLVAAGTSAARSGTDHSSSHRGGRAGHCLADGQAVTTTIGSDAWTSGVPSAPGPTVPRDQLRQLPGAAGGPQMFVSNNPETFTGTGWLAQCGRTTANRGGAAHPLTGTFPVYLYHQNGTGRTAYVHVLVSNPGPSPVTVSARGSVWTNGDKPLVQDPTQRAGTGPCYATSQDWATGNLRTYLPATVLAPGAMAQVAVVPLSSSIVDGLLEVTATGGGVYVYTAATADGDTATAINSTQHDETAAPGNTAPQTDTTYGREAGVYAASAWDTGVVGVDVPAAGSFLGLAVNTTQRQVAALDQTVPAVAALSDSSQRSWGNYGMRYAVRLQLANPSQNARTVALTFGSNVTAATDVPGDTWNGAATLTVDGGTPQLTTVYVRPTAPRCPLGTFLLPPGGRTLVELDFEVPGLITAGSQLLLESV